MKINLFIQIFDLNLVKPYEKKIQKIFGHPGVPGEPPENEQNPYI